MKAAQTHVIYSSKIVLLCLSAKCGHQMIFGILCLGPPLWFWLENMNMHMKKALEFEQERSLRKAVFLNERGTSAEHFGASATFFLHVLTRNVFF